MSSTASNRLAPAPRIAIIGTGFAGLCMGIRLKRAGIDSFTIYEQADSIGGTWRDNVYPGAACDVQSHLYSFSFEPNPRWSRMYAEQQEIRDYLDHCADKYGIRSHIQFNSKVNAARFDQASSTWTLDLENGEQPQFDLVTTATGGLSRPSYPDIPGLQSFAGKLFHSARWDRDYAFEGKRVGVIGTGASSIQFVPQIAPQVKQLKLFQRTPPWIIPKEDRAIGDFEHALYRFLPPLQKLHRVFIYWMLELRVLGFAINPKIMAMPQREAVSYIKASVRDPELQAKVTPDYVFGCKRVLISNDYYPALNRENVELVDTGIREVRPNGVLTNDGTFHELDALILGTGFQASESAAPFPIQGASGVDLNEHWKDGAEAYLGTAVAGFPNFFMIIGPNTGLGHSSLVFIIEAQVDHVMNAIAAMREQRASLIEVREDAQQRFNQRLHKALGRTVWSTGCVSWYRTRTGKNTTLWPGFTFSFRNLARRRLDDAHYRFGVSGQPREPEDSVAPRVARSLQAEQASP
jgi:cation diffusion facilitator CzcD-associated flavoprotein CzcO